MINVGNRMASRSFGRLDSCWKAVSSSRLCTLQSLSAFRLNPQRSKTYRLWQKKYNAISSGHHRCYSSLIVKSPYEDIDIPNTLIPEMVWEAVDRYPEVTALKCGVTGRAYTFSEVYKYSKRFANSLRRAGFSRGDVLALVLPNCPEFAIITLGSLEAELAVSFINHTYTADEMCHQLKDSGSVCVVTAPEQLDVVLKAIAKTENATQSKTFRKIIAVDIPSPESLTRGISRYSEMVADGIDETENSTNGVQSNDVAFLPYSSGTTGLSKGVCLSHRNIVANLLQFSRGRELYPFDKGQDILLGLLPFYHIYGLVVILLNSLTQGGQVVTLPKFEQDSFIRTLANEKLTILMLVPPLILFLGASEKITKNHLRNVRLLFSGAAPLGAADLEKVRVKLPSEDVDVTQGYGLTETSPVVTMPLLPCKNLATVGSPIANTLCKIIDPNTGETLGPNKMGELYMKGPQVMLGYHHNPKATADMIDVEGWLRTGDIGYYDEDSCFYIQDRLKELIKVKGLQVPPAELEELLRTHPHVSDVGVIGVPCPRSGEVPVAYVVRQENKKITAEEIKEFLSERVSRHKQLAEVFFIDSIPKSAAGKILRKDLRQLYKNTHTEG